MSFKKSVMLRAKSDLFELMCPRFSVCYRTVDKRLVDYGSVLFFFFRSMGTLSWEAALSAPFFHPFFMESTLKVKNLLLLEQILSFKSRPLFGRGLLFKAINRKSKTVSLWLYLNTLALHKIML